MLVTLARYSSVIGVPVIVLAITWLIATVTSGKENLAVLQTTVNNIAGDIDLKLQIRDQKIDAISNEVRAIRAQLDERKP